jgi:hypothetical protein
MTRLNEFKALHPEGINLTDEQLETMRVLIDLQADLMLDSYLTSKIDHNSTKL